MALLHSPDAPKPDLTRSIKVNVKRIKEGKTRRTSTTLNYSLCDYFFGRLLNPTLRAELPLTNFPEYRRWLERRVQNWVNEQSVSAQSQLETALAEAIYHHGVQKGANELL